MSHNNTNFRHKVIQRSGLLFIWKHDSMAVLIPLEMDWLAESEWAKRYLVIDSVV